MPTVDLHRPVPQELPVEGYTVPRGATVLRPMLFLLAGSCWPSTYGPARRWRTDVDHIESAHFGDDSLDNLQPLCHECHLAKTVGSPLPWDTASDGARASRSLREQEYLRRVHAPRPLRACDDERGWPATQRSIRSERAREVRRRTKGLRMRAKDERAREEVDRELRGRLVRLGGEVKRLGRAPTLDDLGAALADAPPARRRRMEARLIEMARALADRIRAEP